MYEIVHLGLCLCNDTATTESYTLSLHDALPIFRYFGNQLEQIHLYILDRMLRELLIMFRCL